MNRFPLVLLHHSGGTARVFDSLVKALPPEIEPIPLELPGRGRRWREEPLGSATDAVEDLLAQLPDATGDFAIFGHSMGAYLGLALAARLENPPGQARCTTLFASGNAGPAHAAPLFTGSPLDADDETVLAVNARFGGLDPRIAGHPQLRGRAAALLRTDSAICDSFVTDLRRTVTESPIVVCCGTEDVFTPAQLAKWRLSSTSVTETITYPGGHFYLDACAAELASMISARVGVAVG
ncbi:alpha/beta fold hydrolase [Streptomyces sp. NPDC051162]|uniref:thioesterase II family protein n=1 Tax=unclassified Streptomyces TaxID=2593676 RepID=UPI003436778C